MYYYSGRAWGISGTNEKRRKRTVNNVHRPIGTRRAIDRCPRRVYGGVSRDHRLSVGILTSDDRWRAPPKHNIIIYYLFITIYDRKSGQHY